MTLSAVLLRKAGIGLTAGEKAAATKRAAGTLSDIALRAWATRDARALQARRSAAALKAWETRRAA